MNITIEPAREIDAQALARLFMEFNHPYREVLVTPEQVMKRLARCEKTETTYVARVNDNVVGLICLRIVPNMSDDEPYAEITDLFVEEQSRRLGVAQQLIVHAEEVARLSGAQSLVVITGVGNDAAQSLYRKCDFRPWATALKKHYEPYSCRLILRTTIFRNQRGSRRV
jgi:ribosomal protein S18 acetylase RimI-like enzyme